MKFEIRNRLTGAVQFVSEIEVDENEVRSIKLGLAVRFAIKSGANLRGADLRDAYLSGAYLRDADLRDADLSDADLSDAYLRGADLRGVYLRDADLRDADLRDANLSGANGRKITINNIPVKIWTGIYDVIIFDSHMKVGCEFHSLTDWWSFDNERITKMDGIKARKFWDIWKAPLQSICEANGRA